MLSIFRSRIADCRLRISRRLLRFAWGISEMSLSLTNSRTRKRAAGKSEIDNP